MSHNEYFLYPDLRQIYDETPDRLDALLRAQELLDVQYTELENAENVIRKFDTEDGYNNCVTEWVHPLYQAVKALMESLPDKPSKLVTKVDSLISDYETAMLKKLL